MKELKETQLSSSHIFEGKLLDIRLDEIRLPNDKTSTREYTKHPGASVVIPILPNRKILLIRQYRYAIGEVEIELPAGKLDPGESPEDCVIRELEEETGYRAGKIRLLVEIHPCIGYSSERMWLFLAENLEQTSQNTEHDEFIELFPMPLETAIEMVWSGKIKDVKTIIGILWADKLLEGNNK